MCPLDAWQAVRALTLAPVMVSCGNAPRAEKPFVTPKTVIITRNCVTTVGANNTGLRRTTMSPSEWMDQFAYDLIEHYEAEVLLSGLIYLELSMYGYGVLVVEEKIK